MLALLGTYRAYIITGIVLLSIAAITYGVHVTLANERKIGYDKAVAEYTEKAAVVEKEARARELELSKQIQEARNAATIREQKISDLSTQLSTTSNRLLNTINALRSKLSASSAEAARKQADTALSLLGECQARYGEVAESADRHASDVKLLEEAWPK